MLTVWCGCIFLSATHTALGDGNFCYLNSLPFFLFYFSSQTTEVQNEIHSLPQLPQLLKQGDQDLAASFPQIQSLIPYFYFSSSVPPPHPHSLSTWSCFECFCFFLIELGAFEILIPICWDQTQIQACVICPK